MPSVALGFGGSRRGAGGGPGEGCGATGTSSGAASGLLVDDRGGAADWLAGRRGGASRASLSTTLFLARSLYLRNGYMIAYGEKTVLDR